MDNSDRPDAHRPGGHSAASGPHAESDPLFSDARSSTKAHATGARGVLRRIADRWWQFLLLWLAVSAPIAVLIYVFIKPTFVASSILRIEPASQDIFGPLSRDNGDLASDGYLRTQVSLLTSDKVLNSAVASPQVLNLQAIEKSEDPKNDLRKNLSVEIIPKTNLIRVSLEMPTPDDAVTIVQAVVQSYMGAYLEYSRSTNRDLAANLTVQLAKLGTDVDAKKASLKSLHQKGRIAVRRPDERLNPKTETDPLQPTFRVLTQEQHAKMIAQQIQCDLEYLEAYSHLEATRLVREKNQNEINEELDARADEEFRKDPRVAALIARIDESRRLGASKDQAPSPAVLAAREKHEKLVQEFEELRVSSSPNIRKRLTAADRGVLSESKVRELEVAMEKARKKKEAFAQQFGKIQVQEAEMNDDSFEGTFLTHQINSLMSMEDQVHKNLEQLKFEANQDSYRVGLIDRAAAPKTPSNNKGLKYTAAAPIFAFFLVLGFFMVREIKAGPHI